MTDDRFIELLTKKLYGDIENKEIEEFDNYLAINENYNDLHQLFIEYWAQRLEEYPNTDAILQRMREQMNTTHNTVSKKKEKRFSSSIFKIFKSIAA
ncbi:hypothetical protein FFF34_005060 [Inquilinus sp. KBS0705]|nr:hypothetical protein FFF34_005060 [Inquilinus sp. KBS0705]